MRGKVVVNEQLAVHQEEREVVECPASYKQACIVPEAIADSYNIFIISASLLQQSRNVVAHGPGWARCLSFVQGDQHQ